MNAKNNSLHSWLFISSILITTVMLACKLRLMTYADDVTFSHALEGAPLFDYLLDRYITWSGRIVIEGLMISTITTHIFWKLMIPFCFILSSHLVWSITLKNKLDFRLGTPLVMMAMLLINSPVAGDAQWWVTGFYNYLLPVTCALFLISVVMSPFAGMGKLSLALLLSFIATSSEQVAVLLIVVVPFMLFIESNKRLSNKVLVVSYVAILLGSALTLLSPGSASRFYVEASRFMPQSIEMNILQKSIIGVDRLVEHISTGRNICFSASLIVFIAFIMKSGSNDIVSKLYIALSIACFVLGLTSFSFYMRDIEFLTYAGRFQFIDFGSIKVYGCYLFYLITLISMAAGSIEDRSGEKDYRAFLSLVGGCLVTIAIGLSPTAYASGERVLYVFNVCLVVYTLFNIRRIIK